MAKQVYIWGSDKQSPHSVLLHGTLLTFSDNPTDFDILINHDLARIRFEFPTDAGDVRLETVVEPGAGSVQDPAIVRLRFFNLSGAGIFTDGPIRIGTVGGLALWLCYEVGAATGSRLMKRIHYTLWDGSAPDIAGQLIPPSGHRA